VAGIDRASDAVSEVFGVLNPGGQVIFIEPLVECSYYLITRLVEEESEDRRHAYEVIRNAETVGFVSKDESYFFVERSFRDYLKMLDMYWDRTEREKRAVVSQAEEIVKRLADGSGCSSEDYRLQSACRLNMFRKPD